MIQRKVQLLVIILYGSPCISLSVETLGNSIVKNAEIKFTLSKLPGVDV